MGGGAMVIPHFCGFYIAGLQQVLPLLSAISRVA